MKNPWKKYGDTLVARNVYLYRINTITGDIEVQSDILIYKSNLSNLYHYARGAKFTVSDSNNIPVSNNEKCVYYDHGDDYMWIWSKEPLNNKTVRNIFIEFFRNYLTNKLLNISAELIKDRYTWSSLTNLNSVEPNTYLEKAFESYFPKLIR